MIKDPIKANQYVTVLKLSEKFKSLADLDKLPPKISEPIHIRKDIKIKQKIDFKSMEYRTLYTWEKDLENYKLNINSDHVIRFVVWDAIIEHRNRNIYTSDNNGLLPRSERITKYNPIPVLFYEKSGCLYCAIVNSNDSLTDRVKSLIGKNNIDISSNPLSTNKNIIEWLFWRYMTDKKTINTTNEISDSSNNISSNNISIDEIFGFEGNVLKGDPNDILKGRSPQVSSLDITKAVLCLNSSLTSAKISLNYLGSDITFLYAVNGTISIDSKNTYINKSVCDYKSGEEQLHSCQVLIYLCSIVIPHLISIFNDNSQEFSQEFIDFKQELAIELIKKIIKLNNLK